MSCHVSRPLAVSNFDMSLSIFSVSNKRARDDDYDELEHAASAKRQIRSLPFRTSPTIKHSRLFSTNKRAKPKPLFTQTLTPADSEEETSPPFSCIQSASTQAHPETISLVAAANDAEDVDMDMMDTMTLSPRRDICRDMAMISPKASPRTLVPQEPESMGMQDCANTGRLPTPIYGHFQQSLQPPQLDMLPETTIDITPPQSEKDVEYEHYLRSRRLPSPISEDEAMDFPPAPPAPNNSPFESSAPFETFAPEPQQACGLRIPARLAQPLVSQSPQKGKIMFSMGFRADCEMCRNRVPGHSNHIFRV